MRAIPTRLPRSKGNAGRMPQVQVKVRHLWGIRRRADLAQSSFGQEVSVQEVSVEVSMAILSIQSHVAYGHVGNAAAVFPMQRLGHEVWPIHTVQFSNHTGYGTWRGEVFPASLIDACLQGIEDRGMLATCQGVLSGYMGSAATGEAILRAATRVKAHNPEALWCCDPVIGDVGRGIYVQSGIPEFIRDHALPHANILTPNQFELEWLAGHATISLDDTRRALTALHARGPKTILVTSWRGETTPTGSLDLLASDASGLFRLRTPLLDVEVNGAGDAIAAMFFVHWLRTRSAAEALAAAGSAIWGILAKTAAAKSRELMLVQAQQEIVAPSRLFVAENLGI